MNASRSMVRPDAPYGGHFESPPHARMSHGEFRGPRLVCPDLIDGPRQPCASRTSSRRVRLDAPCPAQRGSVAPGFARFAPPARGKAQSRLERFAFNGASRRTLRGAFRISAACPYVSWRIPRTAACLARSHRRSAAPCASRMSSRRVRLDAPCPAKRGSVVLGFAWFDSPARGKAQSRLERFAFFESPAHARVSHEGFRGPRLVWPDLIDGPRRHVRPGFRAVGCVWTHHAPRSGAAWLRALLVSPNRHEAKPRAGLNASRSMVRPDAPYGGILNPRRFRLFLRALVPVSTRCLPESFSHPDGMSPVVSSVHTATPFAFEPRARETLRQPTA